MLTVGDVAERLNVSVKTVRRWIESGKLEGYKFGKDYRIQQESFNRFIEESKVAPMESIHCDNK